MSGEPPITDHQPSPLTPHPSVAVVGGGVAGLGAAVALCERGYRVELFEARRRLGGRAGSFRDPVSGRMVDYCQHVAMGCCTNLADFCRRTGTGDCFSRRRRLHFIAPDGARYGLSAAPMLPAPLHLAPALMRLGYLGLPDRLRILRTLGRLASGGQCSVVSGQWSVASGHWSQCDGEAGTNGPSTLNSQPSPLNLHSSPLTTHPLPLTIGGWLRRQGEPDRVIRQFWSVVLVSALSETLDHASLAAARKVLVDGFLASRRAYELAVPRVSLDEIFNGRVAEWLARRNVTVHRGTRIRAIDGDARRARAIVLPDGSRRQFDFFIVAVPWRAVRALFPPAILEVLPALGSVEHIASAPITAVHLWFDRPIVRLAEAVLVGRLSQWIFRRAGAGRRAETPESGHYHQVVVSASRELVGRDPQDVACRVRNELDLIWPAARRARLLRWRVVTNPEAVFSVRPGTDRLRPPQQTPIVNLTLAGDWTATGWPATMEGAVRSGYLAAEAILSQQTSGVPQRLLVPDLPLARLTRWMIGRNTQP